MKKHSKKESSGVYQYRDEGVKILVNSFIRKMDGIRIRRSRKSCAAGSRERWRHAFSKFRRVVSMKIAVEKR